MHKLKTAFLMVFAVYADALESLQVKMAALADDMEAILAQAEEEGRDLSEEELATIDEKTTAFEKLQAQMKARSKVQNMSKPAASGSRTRQTAGPNAPAVALNLQQGKAGFKTMGDFSMAVKNAFAPGGHVDPRLVKNAPTTYGQEGVGEDGGFLVPDDFRLEIWEQVNAQGSLLSMCDEYPTSRSSIAVPQDNVAPWDNSNGIQCYWDGEADQILQSKPKLNLKRDSLHRLTALVPVSDELLEDAPMMGAYISRKAPEKMDFKISRAIFAGTGVGQPLGILNAASTVSVAKEGGQAADTLLFENIVNMAARLYAPCMKNAVWLANQDTLPQLSQMVLPTANGVTMPAYVPPGGLSSAPYGTLWGRPVIFHEVTETLGDKGDIALVDLSKYLVATKAGGIKSDTSMHLYFDYNMQAFRFVFRMSGSPWYKSAITPRSGSGNTLSSAVVLDARA